MQKVEHVQKKLKSCFASRMACEDPLYATLVHRPAPTTRSSQRLYSARCPAQRSKYGQDDGLRSPAAARRTPGTKNSFWGFMPSTRIPRWNLRIFSPLRIYCSSPQQLEASRGILVCRCSHHQLSTHQGCHSGLRPHIQCHHLSNPVPHLTGD